jgi:hypothetical protein
MLQGYAGGDEVAMMAEHFRNTPVQVCFYYYHYYYRVLKPHAV